VDRIRNLTGEPLSLYVEGEVVAVLPSEGRVWINANYEWVDYLDAGGYPLPVVRTTTPSISGLPEPRDDTFLVVTGLVAAALPERSDLLSPARIVREGTKSIGCRAFLTQTDNWQFRLEEEQA
jgi:hypothetical protein